MLQLIGGILQLLFLILSKWAERDAEKKAQKVKLQKELTDAIKTKDTSAITAAIGRINRLQ